MVCVCEIFFGDKYFVYTIFYNNSLTHADDDDELTLSLSQVVQVKAILLKFNESHPVVLQPIKIYIPSKHNTNCQ